MKQILKDIFLILTQKEKRRFINLAVLDVIVSVLDIAFLVLLLLIIDFYAQPNHPVNYAGFSFELFAKFPLLPIFLFFLLFSIKNLVAFMVFRMQYHFVFEVASRISKSRLLNYLEGKYTDYVQIDSAVQMRGISQQPLEFCNYIVRAVQQVISQAILIILTIIPIIIYNARLFPLLLLILLPPVFLVAFMMKKKLNVVRISVKTTSERSWQHMKEALAGFVESNVYEKNNFFVDRYHRFQAKLNHYLAEQQTIQNLPPRLIEVFAVFGLFILIIINAQGNNAQGLNIITIGAFVAAAYKIIPGIVKILNSIGQIKTYSFTLAGLSENKNASVKETGNRTPVASIQFDHVFFKYEQETILDDFSLEINAGDFVGIAGPSGVGKSTLINLLLGFVTPDRGEIKINGLATSASDRHQYWSNIAYIKQQSFLIHDSILRNITLDENEPDTRKLKRVMEITGVDELMNKNDSNIHTIITEEGKNLSGGQRQRIILARALYKDFDTIILDEPFNELDEEAESTLLEYLKTLAADGKTVILITHNKEGLSFCNKKIDMA
jgi:ABC-type bacteriocin/lantibiotic exporter with double-glycine peptidase domain